MAVQSLTYRCPHCGRPVEVEEITAGETMVCPHANCGKPFQVKAPTAQPMAPLMAPPKPALADALNAPTDGRPIAKTQAPIAQTAAEVAATTDEVLETVHPVMFRRFPLRFLGYALLVAIGVTGLITAAMHGSKWLALVSLIVGGFGLVRLGLWWLRVRNTSFTVTNKRCIVQTGIVNPETTEVMRSEVAQVEVNQDLVNRVLNVGDVTLRTRGQERKQIVIKAMSSPETLANEIREGHR